MLLKRRKNSERAAATFQRAGSEYPEGLQLIEDMLDDLDRQQDGVHPWHLENVVLRRMAYAAIALANDRTSEILLQQARSGRIIKKMPEDAADFALGLSSKASEALLAANSTLLTQTVVVFDEPTRAKLSAESMTPYWPRYGENTVVEPWQGKDKPVVTAGFLTAMITAGQAIEVEASSLITRISDSELMSAPIPPEYAAMESVTTDLMSNAGENLQHAQDLLTASGRRQVPQPVVDAAFAEVHIGYIRMMDVLIATVCPPVLGEQFLPLR